ncbi:MAG: hypothetical protein KF773_35295 [Deltaproteobacteria bacterium]|nr:hypothetical protein [Deltaproteobacteria bacterium]MCW5805333.1 hypothetical protein [Deltaproteobacteria bacterium]
MTTLCALAFVLLAVSWHVPRVGRTIAGTIAFVTFPLLVKELIGAFDRPHHTSCVVRSGPELGWWLAGLGFAAVMLAATELSRRRRAAEAAAIARAIVLSGGGAPRARGCAAPPCP